MILQIEADLSEIRRWN